MKLNTHKILLMILMAFTLAISASPLAAQVYKTVDKDGNVTYTDRAPDDGTKPMDLPQISVIETPVYEKTQREAAMDATAAGEEIKEVPLRTLRRDYRDFAIISPASEESVWHPEGPIPIAWSVSNSLLEGMTVTVSVDGRRQSATTNPIVAVVGLERGEHTITAEIKDAKNRRIATAEPVVFYVRQPNIYTNRPRPRGGG